MAEPDGGSLEGGGGVICVGEGPVSGAITVPGASVARRGGAVGRFSILGEVGNDFVSPIIGEFS